MTMTALLSDDETANRVQKVTPLKAYGVAPNPARRPGHVHAVLG